MKAEGYLSIFLLILFFKTRKEKKLVLGIEIRSVKQKIMIKINCARHDYVWRISVTKKIGLYYLKSDHAIENEPMRFTQQNHFKFSQKNISLKFKSVQFGQSDRMFGVKIVIPYFIFKKITYTNPSKVIWYLLLSFKKKKT